MLLLASGKITGHPEAHLVYINYLFGLVLRCLYNTSSKLEWYTLNLIAIHIGSLTIISTTILKNNSSKLLKIIFLLLFYSIEIRLILCLQFTTTAALCALAGLILLTKSNSRYRYWGIALFVIASLLRFDAAFLVFVIFSPFFLIDLIENKSFVGSQLLYSFIAVLLALLGKYYNYYCYQSTEIWQYYYAYDLLGHTIRDNPNAFRVAVLPANIRFEDFYLYMKFLVDERLFPIATLKEIHQNIAQISIMTKGGHIINTFRSFSHLLFFLGLACFIIIWNSLSRIKNSSILFSAVLLIVAFCFISLDAQVKYRVFITATLPLFFILSDSISKNFRPIVQYCICVCIVLFAIDFSITTIRIRQEHQKEKKAFTQQKEFVDAYLQDSSHKILAFYDRLALENLNPLYVSNQMHFNQIINSGWMAYYPSNRKIFPSFKCFSQGLDLFILKSDTEIVSKIRDRLLNNYAIVVYPKIETQTESYVIIHFQRK
jgi:hypothetical protein